MKKNFQYILPVISVLVFIVCIILKMDYTTDDAYIYLQYAKNLTSNLEFSFNPGDPSYGVTSPFWVLILTIPFYLGFDPLFFAKIVDLLFAILSMVVFYRLTRNIFLDNKYFGIISLSAFILNVWFIRWAYTGMETSLAVFMMLFIFYNYLNENFKLTFFLSGLFFLIRPESFVLAVCLWLVKFITDIKNKKLRIRNFIKYILFYFLPIAPFWLYAIFMFNTIVPNTVYAKSTQSFGITIFFNQIFEIIKTLIPSDIITGSLTILFIILVIKRKVFHAYASMIVWFIGLITLYLITDADIISRYLLIITPLFALLGIKALELMKINYKKFGLILAETVLVVLIIQTLLVYFILVKPHTDSFSYGINNTFKPIAHWLKDSTDENSIILLNDIGAIGYYSERNVVDAAALINSDISLNKRIMSTPLEERMSTINLLKFIEADYVIERDKEKDLVADKINGKKLEFKMVKEFPSLGISDNSPTYYKIYKVNKIPENDTTRRAN